MEAPRELSSFFFATFASQKYQPHHRDDEPGSGNVCDCCHFWAFVFLARVIKSANCHREEAPGMAMCVTIVTCVAFFFMCVNTAKSRGPRSV